MRIVACLCLGLLAAGAAMAQGVVARPGDTLQVSVLGEEELSHKFVVRDNGTIGLPLIGDVAVEGKDPSAIALLLSERLAEFVKNPQVTVEIVEVGKIKVVASGAVKSAGVYFVPRDSRIADVLAAAGGLTPTADASQVTLVRGATSEVVDFRRFLTAGDASVNPVLQANDSLLVPEVMPVRVEGMVVRPGPYFVGESVSPWDLIGQAGGLAPNANARQAILRLRTGESRVIDLTALLQLSNAADAPLLKPGDVLVIPGFTMQVSVLGGVARPGSVYVQEGGRVLEAITQAGGVTEFAVLDQAYLIRAGGRSGAASPTRQPVNLRKLLLEGDMTCNLGLRSGDELWIPVSTPGARGPSTLERMGSLLGPLLYLLF